MDEYLIFVFIARNADHVNKSPVIVSNLFNLCHLIDSLIVFNYLLIFIICSWFNQ